MDVSDLFRTAHQVISYIGSHGVKFSKHIIVFYESKKIRQTYRIGLGNPASKSGTVSNFLKSKIAKQMNIGKVERISILGGTAGEDLSEVTTNVGSDTIIDFARLYQVAKSSEIVIEFEKQVAASALNMLIPVIKTQSNLIYHSDGKVEFIVEVVLAQGKEWKGKFDSMMIQDIKIEGGLDFTYRDLKSVFPRKVQDLMDLVKKSDKVDRKVEAKLRKITEAFKRLETDEDIRTEFIRAVSSDKPLNTNISKVWISIGKNKLQNDALKIPEKIHLQGTLQANAEDFALSLTITLDMARVNSVISDLMGEVEL